jgi:hypothetical protein
VGKLLEFVRTSLAEAQIESLDRSGTMIEKRTNLEAIKLKLVNLRSC